MTLRLYFSGLSIIFKFLELRLFYYDTWKLINVLEGSSFSKSEIFPFREIE